MKFRERIKQLKYFKNFLSKREAEQLSDEDIPECLQFLLGNNEEEFLLQATASLFSKIYPITKKHLERPTDNDPEYLMCHLRDDIWLAITMQTTQNLDINLMDIIQFVRTSEIFNEARYDYEKKIIKQQLESMLYSDNYITTNDNYYKRAIKFDPNCDTIFKTCIINTLTTFGINIETIEEYLEQNSIWKNIMMERAFKNTYEPISYTIEANPEKFKLAEQEHKEKWLRLRMYEYYQNNKSSVDKYGIISDDMILSTEELKELKVYLKTKDLERRKIMNKTRKHNLKEVNKYDSLVILTEDIYLCRTYEYDENKKEIYEYAYIIYDDTGEIHHFDYVINKSTYNRNKQGFYLYTEDYVFKCQFTAVPLKIFDIKNKKVIIDEEEITKIFNEVLSTNDSKKLTRK